MRTVDHPRTRILHRVNLETVAGVETSFEQFLRGTTNSALSHQVLVHKHIHPALEPVISRCSTDIFRRVELKRWHGIRIPAFASDLRARNTARFLQDSRPDLIVAWNNFANSEMVALARAIGRPLVYYEHGNGWGHEKASRRKVENFLASTNGVICNSRAAQRMLQLRWGYAGEYELVYCAIDDTFEAPLPVRSPVSHRHLRIGICGRLAPMKGLSLALFMLKALCGDHALDAELHLAGTGPQENDLRRLAERLGLKNRVVFHGLVRDIRAFYDNVDLQVVPSIHEPFGRVSIEAQARGCPVVVAGVDGLPETLIANRSGLVVPTTLSLRSHVEFGSDGEGLPALVYDPMTDNLVEPRLADPGDLARAVCHLVGDPEGYRRFSETARSQALERFSQQEFVSKLHSALIGFAA